MGNRAVITWGNKYNYQTKLGIYLHWNGGLLSVNAFLEYCKLKRYRTPDKDNYGYARLCQVIGNFFGSSNSVGIDVCVNLDCDNGDNGVYLCKGWETVDHLFANPHEEDYDYDELLEAIDQSQPPEEQLGHEFLSSELVSIKDLKIGDTVFIASGLSGYKPVKVAGFSDEKIWIILHHNDRDGYYVKNAPYYILNGHEHLFRDPFYRVSRCAE